MKQYMAFILLNINRVSLKLMTQTFIRSKAHSNKT